MDDNVTTYEDDWELSTEEVYEILKDTHSKEDIKKIIKAFDGKPTKQILSKIKIIGKNAIITQSNQLVEASQSLTSVELRIVNNLISTLDPKTEDDFKCEKVSIDELAKKCKLNPKTAYEQIKKACNNIINKNIIVDTFGRDGKEITIRRPWFIQLDTLEGPRYVLFKFHPDLHDELLQFQQLKRGFVSTKGDIVNELADVHSMRLYHLMIKYHKIKRCEYKIDQLVKIFKLEGKYIDKRTGIVNASVLIDKVVKGAIEKINRISDLFVEYKPIKKGKKITGVRFFISKKSDINRQNCLALPKQENSRNWFNSVAVKTALDSLKLYGFTKLYSFPILNKFENEDDFVSAANKAIESLLHEKETIQNPGGYLFQYMMTYDPYSNKSETEEIDNIINNAETWDEITINVSSYAKDENEFADALYKASEIRKDLYLQYVEEAKNMLHYEYSIEDEVQNYRIEHSK